MTLPPTRVYFEYIRGATSAPFASSYITIDNNIASWNEDSAPLE